MQKIKNHSFFVFWQRAGSELRKLRSLTGASFLAALGMVIKPFSVNTGFFRVSFTFLANALSGYLYGPLAAGLTAVVVDILGFLLKPDGAYFPGFTLSAFVSGFIYGCWLYRKKVSLWRTFAACATNTLVVSILLNPLWLSIMMGKAWPVLVSTRIASNLILLPVNTILLTLLLKVVQKHASRLTSH